MLLSLASYLTPPDPDSDRHWRTPEDISTNYSPVYSILLHWDQFRDAYNALFYHSELTYPVHIKTTTLFGLWVWVKITISRLTDRVMLSSTVVSSVVFNYLISLRETWGHLGPIVVVRTQEPTWAIPHLTRQNIDLVRRRGPCHQLRSRIYSRLDLSWEPLRYQLRPCNSIRIVVL